MWWLNYGLKGQKNPTGLQSTNVWQDALDCQEKGANQAVVDFKVEEGPYLFAGAGVNGILPASLLDPALKANADLQKNPINVDLTKGSGNTAAFKGAGTMDNVLDGTGPYVFQSYTPGQQYVFVKNPNYWDTNNPPHLDKIVYKVEAKVTNQLDDAKTGVIQYGMDYRLSLLKDVENIGGNSKVELVPESGAEKVDLNICQSSPQSQALCGATQKKSPYLANKTIRQAMLMAVNRQKIVDDIALGKSEIPKDSWMYLGASYIDDPGIPKTGYDPGKANSMLDQAGFKKDPKCSGGNGRAFSDGSCITLDLVTTAGNSARTAAEAPIAADLAAVGIIVNQPYQEVKSGQLFGAFKDGGTVYSHAFDMAMYTNTMQTPAEPDNYLPGYHGDCGGTCPDRNQIPSAANAGQGQNGVGVNVPELDKAFDNGHNVIDLKKRADFYKQAEKLLAQQYQDIPLYRQVNVDSYSAKVQNIKRNDIVWTYNIGEWYCTGGSCT
jgi:ABC-type transport system substrate-binding protein